jgi:hypothetical protein
MSASSTVSICSHGRNKSVRWSNTCTLRQFEKATPVDISNAWYNDDDYKSFKTHCKILAKLGKEIGPDALETYCNDSYRGLEHIVKGKAFDLRRMRRITGWDAVLDEQHEQFLDTRRGRKLDWTKIYNAYRPISRDALKNAHLKGVEDAIHIQILIGDEESSSSTTCENNNEPENTTKALAIKSSLKPYKTKISTNSKSPSIACIPPPARRGWQETSSFNS